MRVRWWAPECRLRVPCGRRCHIVIRDAADGWVSIYLFWCRVRVRIPRMGRGGCRRRVRDARIGVRRTCWGR